MCGKPAFGRVLSRRSPSDELQQLKLTLHAYILMSVGKMLLKIKFEFLEIKFELLGICIHGQPYMYVSNTSIYLRPKLL